MSDEHGHLSILISAQCPGNEDGAAPCLSLAKSLDVFDLTRDDHTFHITMM